MNCSYGKLAQRKGGTTIQIDDVEQAENYIKENWQIVKGIGLRYMYKKFEEKAQLKSYYTPIIPCLINGESRVHMNKQYHQFNKKNLLYTDTDSIIYTGKTPNKIEIGTELGQFKKEHTKQEATIYGTKTYTIGQKMVAAGIKIRDTSKETFKKGIVTNKKMRTINTTSDTQLLGTFKTEIRNLKEQLANYQAIQENLKEQQLLVDTEINNIHYFLPKIQQI